MSADISDQSFLDRPAARLLAVAVALVAMAALAWINRDAFRPAPTVPASIATNNPALDECLKQRVGAVEQMRQEGVVNDAQYAEFKGRAISFCEAQFPPVR